MSNVTVKQINSLFPPELYNKSPIDNVLLTTEKNIIVIYRKDKEHISMYLNFDELFKLYLSKLPQGPVKKYVSNIFGKNIVYIGLSSGKRNNIIFSRLLQSKETEKLSGIVLDSSVLDIDIKTGETNSIDDCIYATYFGIIRSSILAHKDSISKDIDLHKLMSTYICLIIIRSLNKSNSYNDIQKNAIYMISLYCFYRHFLGYKHPAVISLLPRKFNDVIKQETFDKYLDILSKTASKYNNIKDIPKIMIDFNLTSDTPAQIIIQILRIMGNSGFYTLIGSLDQFIAMTILARYPTGLYPKTAMLGGKIHDSIEKIMISYIEKIQFEETKLLN